MSATGKLSSRKVDAAMKVLHEALDRLRASGITPSQIITLLCIEVARMRFDHDVPTPEWRKVTTEGQDVWLDAARLREMTFQARVRAWLGRITEGDPTDIAERLHRTTEEMAEVGQAGNLTLDEWCQIGARTFSRPKGELKQEIGGLMLTAASLASVAEIDMLVCGEAELQRVNLPEMMVKIRAKRATRAGRGPLPGLDPDFIPTITEQGALL